MKVPYLSVISSILIAGMLPSCVILDDIDVYDDNYYRRNNYHYDTNVYVYRNNQWYYRNGMRPCPPPPRPRYAPKPPKHHKPAPAPHNSHYNHGKPVNPGHATRPSSYHHSSVPVTHPSHGKPAVQSKPHTNRHSSPRPSSNYNRPAPKRDNHPSRPSKVEKRHF